MSGVYGEQLAYFPEFMQPYDVFSMAPKTGAGYGERKLVKQITGYFSRKVVSDEGVVDNTRTENQRGYLWTEDDVPRSSIRQGLYMEDDGELFTFMSDNAYVREGGFIRHKLQLVAGANGTQTPHARVNLGRGDYS